jgi:hypothetical protein
MSEINNSSDQQQNQNDELIVPVDKIRNLSKLLSLRKTKSLRPRSIIGLTKSNSVKSVKSIRPIRPV